MISVGVISVWEMMVDEELRELKSSATHLVQWKRQVGRSLVTLVAALSFSAMAAHGSRVSELGKDQGMLQLPYALAGLTEHQAAAHLLDRFAFGARPGDVEAMVDFGLSAWIEGQLEQSFVEKELPKRIATLDALKLSPAELEEEFVNPADYLRMKRREARMQADEGGARSDSQNPDQMRRAALAEIEQSGKRLESVLIDQLFANKMLRGIYSENQLAEVLADFWFNHFNIDAREKEARPFLLSYERDAIRPHVLGNFSELLLATASHPAMLMYLDNARSAVEPGRETTAEFKMRGGPDSLRPERRRSRLGGGRTASTRRVPNLRPATSAAGLNENYARELMELHTLGVDGGYTQADVVEVARALSGWMALRQDGPMRERLERRIASEQVRHYLGFVEREGFFFNAAFHDAEKKSVLGHDLPAGRGIEDGLDVLELLAAHPSTARFVSFKLAQRFVADEPSDALVSQLAQEFTSSGGSTASVLRSLVQSGEFWRSRRQKIKSPVDLVFSSVRALDASVRNPARLGRWLQKLGQPVYRYPAPTGFPETADHWVNTGGLLNRMNFGLEIAQGTPTVRFSLLALVDGREPESVEEGLRVFAKILMPQRDHEATIQALLPALGNRDLPERLGRRLQMADQRAESEDEQMSAETTDSIAYGDFEMAATVGDDGEESVAAMAREPMIVAQGSFEESASLEHLVGLLLGSPEFQRR